MDRFHAMWFGYYTVPHPPDLTNAFRTETRDLLMDVVFDRKADHVHFIDGGDGGYARAAKQLKHKLKGPDAPPSLS